MKKILIGIVAISTVILTGIKTTRLETTEIKRGTKVECSNYIFANDFEINDNGRGKIFLGNRQIDNVKMWAVGIDMSEILEQRPMMIEKSFIYGIQYKTKYTLGKSIIEELKEEMKKI